MICFGLNLGVVSFKVKYFSHCENVSDDREVKHMLKQ